MMRKCHWCKRSYDTKSGSSIWCDRNPHRGRGAKRRKPRLFTMLMLPSAIKRGARLVA